MKNNKYVGSSLENEQSVNLDDDELQSLLEQQKNCTTQKENSLQLENAVSLVQRNNSKSKD